MPKPKPKPKRQAAGAPPIGQVELVPVAELRSHPRNYNGHPADQLEHLVQSIREHGVYRNVVIANDGTVLAGHGVVEAARQAGLTAVPAVRLPYAPTDRRAYKVLVGDNEIAHLADVNDRLLTDMLKELQTFDPAELLGTGFNAAQLANRLFVTRPASEVQTFDTAAAWAGMPDYDEGGEIKLIVKFRNAADREQYVKKTKLAVSKQYKGTDTWATWWPPKDKQDPSSLKFKA